MCILFVLVDNGSIHSGQLDLWGEILMSYTTGLFVMKHGMNDLCLVFAFMYCFQAFCISFFIENGKLKG